MDKQSATQIMERIHACMKLVTEIVQIADATCNDTESRVIRRGIGYILSEMQDRVADPIYRTYPELVPKGVDYAPLEGPTISDLASRLKTP